LDTGALRQRIDSPVKGLLGDMTISRAGEIFVSEGIHGAVLRLRPGANRLERIDMPGEFPSPQTPALSSDEKTLYVPDYVRGIAAITLATGGVTWLQPADDIALSGIDGLYVYRGSFLAVQNGTTPPRIVRCSLDLRKQEVLEANTPALGEPTHGTIVGNTFYFIANSGWDEYDDQGKKKAGSGPVESTVRKIALK
jgi:sugar lactone lactonase YvrE